MGHSITALIVKGKIDDRAVEKYDLSKRDIGFSLSLFYLDHYYSACWQFKTETEGYLDFSRPDGLIMPNENVIAKIASDLTRNNDVNYAIVCTDYFGGIGDQWAGVFMGRKIINTECTINKALSILGVKRQPNSDEFDTVGLGSPRHNPEYLEKYMDMADELGV